MEIKETVQETESQITETLISPLFLLICYMITIAVITILLFRWSNYFTPNEQPIALKYVTTQKKKEFGGEPVEVKVGLFINDFYTFDINNDIFVFNGVLTCEFDPSLISLKTIEQISFDRGEILYRSPATTYMLREKMFARYDVRVKLSGNLDYAWFPFEDHRLSIVLINKVLSPSDLIFKTSNESFAAPDMSSVGWYKFGSKALEGYLDAPLRQGSIQYPAVVFSIDYGRYRNIRNVFTIILPMLILFFIALFSVIINTKEKGNFAFVVSMPVQTIAGLIAFRFVIESMSPKVGYFMYSDYFFFIFLFLMFGILLFHTFGSELGALPRKVIIVLCNSIIICFFVYFLNLAQY